jgi:hypothetical protein
MVLSRRRLADFIAAAARASAGVPRIVLAMELGDAADHRERDLVARVHQRRLAEHALDALDDDARVAAAGPGQDDGQRVSRVARHQILRAHRAAGDHRQVAQRLVATRWPKRSFR